jgi:hypothetical protein
LRCRSCCDRSISREVCGNRDTKVKLKGNCKEYRNAKVPKIEFPDAAVSAYLGKQLKDKVQVHTIGIIWPGCIMVMRRLSKIYDTENVPVLTLKK